MAKIYKSKNNKDNQKLGQLLEEINNIVKNYEAPTPTPQESTSLAPSRDDLYNQSAPESVSKMRVVWEESSNWPNPPQTPVSLVIHNSAEWSILNYARRAIRDNNENYITYLNKAFEKIQRRKH